MSSTISRVRFKLTMAGETRATMKWSSSLIFLFAVREAHTWHPEHATSSHDYPLIAILWYCLSQPPHGSLSRHFPPRSLLFRGLPVARRLLHDFFRAWLLTQAFDSRVVYPVASSFFVAVAPTCSSSPPRASCPAVPALACSFGLGLGVRTEDGSAVGLSLPALPLREDPD